MLRLLKISLLLLLTAQISVGQKLVNSPYSRFGPGTLEPVGSFKTISLGGAGVAISDPLNINYLNPASYCSLDTNSFVFDFGLDYRIITLSDGTENYQSDDINFHHLMIGFPLGKKMGFAAGVIPYSSGYYNLLQTVESGDPDYDPIIGEIDERHKGVGGYNKFFFGLGVNPVAGLSLGGNMTFLFGNIDRETSYYFLEDNNYFNNIAKESILLRGFNFDLGAQYKFSLKNNYFATLGLSYSTNGNYRGETSSLLARYSIYTGSEYSTDTLSYEVSDNETIKLPGHISYGIALGKVDKFMLTADYTSTNWANAIFLGHESYFVKSNSINVGAQLIPNKDANYNLLNRVEYRLGGHLTDSHLMLNGEQLKEFGITFGAGIPLKRSNSRINLYFEYGNRYGSLENGLHNETFYNFGLSFNFYDYWFLKRKYD